MSKISKEEIEKVAKLSRIEMEPEELDSMRGDLESTLEFVGTLDSVSTKDVEPTAQVTGLSDVWREDVVKKSKISREALLRNAPEVLDGHIKVSKVL